MTRKLLFVALCLMASLFTGRVAAQTTDGLTVILDEKFDAFTEGSETEPGTTDISSYSSGRLSKLLSGWSGRKVYEAGGMLKVDNSGQLQTARYDLSANDGVVKITMRVKSLADYGTAVSCQVGYNTAEQIMLPDGDWHTVSLILEKGTSSSYVRLSPYMVLEGFLIDELKIETGESLVKAPEAALPSQADGQSFTASWSRVASASDYLLDVYTRQADGTPDYLLQDQAVSATRYQVTGLTEGATYYYTVRARKANGAVSDYSNEVQVVKVLTELAAPVATDPTDLSATGFTAHWQPVADATGYIVTLQQTETLTEARDADVLSEDFAKVTIGSLSSVEFGKTQEYLDAYTAQPGWFAVWPAYAKGYLALSPFGGEAGSLTTPSVDLSAAQGVFKLRVNMAEQAYGADYSGAKVTVTVYNGEEQAEQQTVTLDKGFKDYELSFTKGSADTYVELSYSGDKKLFIDDLAISQSLQAGDQLTTLVEKRETADTQASFTLSNATDGLTYAYTVQAEGQTVSDGEVVSIVSAASNRISFSLPTTGIQAVDGDAAFSATVEGGQLVVNLPADAPVRVYNAQGVELSNVQGHAGRNVIAAPRGVLLVVSGAHTAKVVR